MLEPKRYLLTVKPQMTSHKRPVVQLVEGHSLPRALKVARQNAGLSQEEVAAALDKHPMTVSRWEREKNPSAPSEEDLDRLAVMYHTTKSALRYGENVVREPPPVAFGLPQSIRLWIQDFLTSLVRADVSEREVEEARRVLTAPELARLLSGGEPGEETEAQILRGLEGFGAAIRDTLRSRGYEISK